MVFLAFPTGEEFHGVRNRSAHHGCIPSAGSEPLDRKVFVAIVTAKGISFHEIGKYSWLPSFHTVLAQHEERDPSGGACRPGIHGMCSISTASATERRMALKCCRKSASCGKTWCWWQSPNRATARYPESKSGGRGRVFPDSMDFSQLAGVLLGAIEKRALQFEGRWLLHRVESKVGILRADWRQRGYAESLWSNPGRGWQQRQRAVAGGERRGQGAGRPCHCAVGKPAGKAFRVPELLGPAREPDRIRTVRIRTKEPSPELRAPSRG